MFTHETNHIHNCKYVTLYIINTHRFSVKMLNFLNFFFCTILRNEPNFSLFVFVFHLRAYRRSQKSKNHLYNIVPSW